MMMHKRWKKDHTKKVIQIFVAILEGYYIACHITRLRINKPLLPPRTNPWSYCLFASHVLPHSHSLAYIIY